MSDINNILNKQKSEKGFMKTLNRMKKMGKKTKITLGILILLVLIVGYFIFKPKNQTYEWATVQRGNIIQEVSANGTVEGTNEVDLKFKTAGTIDKVLVRVGDQIKKGAVLARLDTGEVYTQYLQSQASYNQAQAKLNQLLAGASDAEIRICEQVLANAQTSLNDAKAKAENDLNQQYNGAISQLVSSSSKCNKAITDMKDIEGTYFYDTSIFSRNFIEKRKLAEEAFLGVSGIQIGAQDLVETALEDPTQENIDAALTALLSTLQKTISLLDYAKTASSDPSLAADVSTTDKATITTDASEIATAFTGISSAQTDISNQKITNQININSADSALKKAQLELDELTSPKRDVDIAVYRAEVDRCKANFEEYSQKMDDASIVAPFDGQIAKIDGKIGEVITANSKNIITLLNPNGFQIKADIPETDIGEVALNNPVSIVLDAYPEETFIGQILEIDPAETTIDGVSYYQVRVLFTEPSGKLRSGMSGDVTMQTDKKENVLFVPQSAVITRNGNKLARILGDDNKISEVNVVPGLRGSNGDTEIIDGLSEGQKVITYLKTP